MANAADRISGELDDGTALLGRDGAREIEEPLQRVSDYVDRVPEWEPGTRLHDLLRAAVRHYRDGAAAIRSATPRDAQLVAAASEALARGNASVRKTDATLQTLETATGFSC